VGSVQNWWWNTLEDLAQCSFFIKVCPTKPENVMLSKHYHNSYEHDIKKFNQG
jgi:hypothetical protein